MKRWLKDHVTPYMIRPIVYKTMSYSLTGVALVLLWHRFLNVHHLQQVSYVLTILGVCYLALAWLNYLRLDGINIPLLSLFPIGTPNKRSAGMLTDMMDHVDIEVTNLADLNQEERATTLLLANLFCAALFLLLSLAFSLNK